MAPPPAAAADVAPLAAATAAAVRIAKRLARAGVCSRRDAELLIGEGRVSVNGQVLTTPAVLVGPGDDVRVDGHRIGLGDPPRLWRYHKPLGLVTTARDEQGRPTVFDALPRHLPRVISVGRLDLNSEGLLLLTNDGQLARHLELPATGWERVYRVRVHGRVQPERLAALAGGVSIEGVRYGPVRVAMEPAAPGASNSWATVTITEGKNREVRRVLEHVGLTVNRLIRTGYGPFRLDGLERAAVAEVPWRVLQAAVGPALEGL